MKSRAPRPIVLANRELAGAILRTLTLAGTLIIAGCAGLPGAVTRVPSNAIPASTETTLGRIATTSSPDSSMNGFRLLSSSSFALDTRFQLIRRAERSLDVQYFLLANDGTGRAFLRALRDAARRGVRVRLLLDDLNTAGADALFLGLAAEPNVELRLFNPFTAARGSLLTRLASSLTHFERANHRMHNKLFIVDGSMAVAGGRNIADEYFSRRERANFIDLDVFVTGPVVGELAAFFDQYWNSPPVYPIEAIVRPGDSVSERQGRFDALTWQAHAPASDDSLLTDVLGYGPLADELDDGRLGLIWGPAEAFADPANVDMADKVGHDASSAVRPVRFSVYEHVREATDEVTLITPYFIPGNDGMAVFRNARTRGVVVNILTNSLASTDQAIVHAGYRRYRKPLLEAGVNLYELSSVKSSETSRWRLPKAAVGGLHAKAAVFDGKELFVGSMNLDPRSGHYNTELGIIFHSPQLAREATRLAKFAKLQAAHRLRLTPKGDIEWVGPSLSTDGVHTDEPETDFGTRALLDLIGPLAPEELL